MRAEFKRGSYSGEMSGCPGEERWRRCSRAQNIVPDPARMGTGVGGGYLMWGSLIPPGLVTSESRTVSEETLRDRSRKAVVTGSEEVRGRVKLTDYFPRDCWQLPDRHRGQDGQKNVDGNIDKSKGFPIKGRSRDEAQQLEAGSLLKDKKGSCRAGVRSQGQDRTGRRSHVSLRRETFRIITFRAKALAPVAPVLLTCGSPLEPFFFPFTCLNMRPSSYLYYPIAVATKRTMSPCQA